MATVGRNRAVAEFSTMKMAGFFAWLMWLVVHLRSILGIRNKTVVLFNWIWNISPTHNHCASSSMPARRKKSSTDRRVWPLNTGDATCKAKASTPKSAPKRLNPPLLRLRKRRRAKHSMRRCDNN